MAAGHPVGAARVVDGDLEAGQTGLVLSHTPLRGALSWNTCTRIRAVGRGSLEAVTVTAV